MFTQRRPSEILTRYVEGNGGEYELDDLVTNGRASEDFVVGPLMDINERFSTSEYRIGLMNPESFEEIKKLADKLRSVGL
jgi:hypothetical protein